MAHNLLMLGDKTQIAGYKNRGNVFVISVFGGLAGMPGVPPQMWPQPPIPPQQPNPAQMGKSLLCQKYLMKEF
jgi:hypothetical protein